MAKKPATPIRAKPPTRVRATAPARARHPAHGSANLPAVRVRMYRQGLGACFLSTFDVAGDERHMLIDFGTLVTSAKPPVKMPDVIADIAKATGKRLEILVATHAH